MDEEIKRTNRIEIRVSDLEKDCIMTKFKASKLASLSDYLRKQAVFGSVLLIDTTYIDDLKRQVIGACTNINQIARICNSDKHVSAGMTDEIAQAKSTFETLLFELMKLEKTIEQRIWQ